MSKWGMAIERKGGDILINTTDTIDELTDLIDNEITHNYSTGKDVWVTGYMINGITVSGMLPTDSYIKMGLKLAISDLKIGDVEHTVMVCMSDGSKIHIQLIAPTSKCEGCIHDYADRLQTIDTTLEDEQEMVEDRLEYKLPQPTYYTHIHHWEYGHYEKIKFRRCSCGLKQIYFGHAGSMWIKIDMLPEGVQFQ